MSSLFPTFVVVNNVSLLIIEQPSTVEDRYTDLCAYHIFLSLGVVPHVLGSESGIFYSYTLLINGTEIKRSVFKKSL